MEVDKQPHEHRNTCAVYKQGCHSVQNTVLLLKSDMLADSIYSMPCTTSSAVIRRVSAHHVGSQTKSMDC